MSTIFTTPTIPVTAHVRKPPTYRNRGPAKCSICGDTAHRRTTCAARRAAEPAPAPAPAAPAPATPAKPAIDLYYSLKEFHNCMRDGLAAVNAEYKDICFMILLRELKNVVDKLSDTIDDPNANIMTPTRRQVLFSDVYKINHRE